MQALFGDFALQRNLMGIVEWFDIYGPRIWWLNGLDRLFIHLVTSRCRVTRDCALPWGAGFRMAQGSSGKDRLSNTY